MTLFDPGPAAPEPPPMSAYLRRKARYEAIFAMGAHPITRYPLANNGETCGTCAHRDVKRWSRRYNKCDLNDTNSQATDLVISWPACSRWEPACDRS